jgi:DNA-directed RNA polymerase subunit RPC12/RpoP
MATILKCVRCQQVMDVTSISVGSTVRCPDCGQNAKVPTGATNLAVKTVSAPVAPPPPPPAAAGRGTRIRGRSSGTMPAQKLPEQSSNGLWLGLGIGAVAVIAVIVFFTMNNAPPPEPPPRMSSGPREPVVFKPNLPPSSEKPIVLGSGSGGKDDPKATQISRPAETADNVNWDAILRDLRPGGGFEHLDRPEGVAFQKVKGFGKAAYPKLIKYIDDEDTAIAIGAVAALNALTGRDSALPKGVNKAKIKAEWEEWLKGEGSKPADAPKQ